MVALRVRLAALALAVVGCGRSELLVSEENGQTGQGGAGTSSTSGSGDLTHTTSTSTSTSSTSSTTTGAGGTDPGPGLSGSGCEGKEEGRAIAVDASGSVFVAGQFTGVLDFGNIALDSGEYGAGFLAKLACGL
ncbi:MAG: hypothetical protein HY744_01565 [Deltaproteobacteria bacterium]|nr:hypothetical protein [Deltaproteobacteria bacterium]